MRSRVLVIDDDATSRLKLTSAITALGHDAEAVTGGREGLDALAQGGVDLLLLDLMMPEVDGFTVLKEIAARPELSHLPVLVISGADDVRDISRAIELGADDVLPKTFDAVVLRARVSTALERRRLRLAEADYLAQVHRLSAAAHVLEETRFDPARLGLDPLSDRDDDVGRLAQVFLDMARTVHRREQAKRRRIGLLAGLLFLAAFGVLQGLHPVFSLLLANTEMDALAVAGLSLLSAAALMWFAASFGQGRALPSRDRLIALVVYAGVSLAMPRLVMLVSAERLEAQTMSMLIALQPLLVFLLTVAIGAEARSWRRLGGLLLGFFGVVLTLLDLGSGTTSLDLSAVALMLLVPLGYALGVVALALREPRAADNQMTQSAIALTVGGVVLTLWAAAAGVLPPWADLAGTNGALILALGAAGAGATLVVIKMVRVTGAVFASQSGYAAATGGVVWSVALLGEPMTAGTWFALVAVIVGFLLVMPREEEVDLDAAVSGSPKLAAARRLLRI